MLDIQYILLLIVNFKFFIHFLRRFLFLRSALITFSRILQSDKNLSMNFKLLLLLFFIIFLHRNFDF